MKTKYDTWENISKQLNKNSQFDISKEYSDWKDWVHKKPYKYDKNWDDYGWEIKKETVVIPVSINDVMKKFKPEELIDAIGIENVEAILRSRKLKKIKEEIKKK